MSGSQHLVARYQGSATNVTATKVAIKLFQAYGDQVLRIFHFRCGSINNSRLQSFRLLGDCQKYTEYIE